MSKGRIAIMGNIDTLEPDGSVEHHRKALLIVFDNPEDIRDAIKNERCEFTFSEPDQEPDQ